LKIPGQFLKKSRFLTIRFLGERKTFLSFPKKKLTKKLREVWILLHKIVSSTSVARIFLGGFDRLMMRDDVAAEGQNSGLSLFFVSNWGSIDSWCERECASGGQNPDLNSPSWLSSGVSCKSPRLWVWSRVNLANIVLIGTFSKLIYNIDRCIL
jgi:hypothetical protein